MSNLAGKVAIVTGSTSGIGWGMAQKLAAQGVHIMMNGMGDAAEIKKMQQQLIDEYKVKVEFSGADMSKPVEIRQMVADAESKLGSLDILVNNAGIQFTANIQDFPDDKWDAIIAINLSASFHSIKAAVPGMLKRGWGRIINISSAHGLVASPQKSAYVAAKHGIVGLTKTVALETAAAGLTCNAICPGWVLTPLVEKQIQANADKDHTDYHTAEAALLDAKEASKKFTTPEQIGDLVVFLCSPGADNMTGSSLSIDGGWVAE